MLLFSAREASGNPPLVIVGNCVPLEDSLAGEPDCVTIRLPRESGDQVGVCAVRDIPCGVCFGPLLKVEEEEEEDVKNPLWMQVRSLCLMAVLINMTLEAVIALQTASSLVSRLSPVTLET